MSALCGLNPCTDGDLLGLPGLGAELSSGIGIREQVWLAGGPTLLTFVIVALASYIPIVR
jgi:hypothetical protein